jgi:hypothetical protein
METHGFIRDLTMCTICAKILNDVESVKIGHLLKIIYAFELPHCENCKGLLGVTTLVGRHKQNGRILGLGYSVRNSHALRA